MNVRNRMISIMAAGFILATSFISSAVYAKDITDTHFNQLTERSIVAPGDFAWNDITYVPGKITVRVNLSTQMAYVTRGDLLIGVANVSSGRQGYETPVGKFTILGKEDNHWSKKYKADMPYTMWVTNDGVALHSGSTPGRTTSHGCIHLPDNFAALLYQAIERGATVMITNNHSAEKLNLDLN
jgi:lipoprotein-anchoring transpeptidase ErfK/SrfK